MKRYSFRNFRFVKIFGNSSPCYLNMSRLFLLIVAYFLATYWAPSESLHQPVPFVIPKYGRWVNPTVGEVWPKPQQQTFSQTFFVLRPNYFQFQVITFTNFFSFKLLLMSFFVKGCRSNMRYPRSGHSTIF